MKILNICPYFVIYSEPSSATYASFGGGASHIYITFWVCSPTIELCLLYPPRVRNSSTMLVVKKCFCAKLPSIMGCLLNDMVTRRGFSVSGQFFHVYSLFTGCRGGNRFISTRDSGVSEGRLHVIKFPSWYDSMYIKRMCYNQCQFNQTQEPCWGFSVNYNNNSCSLYYNFDQQLGVIGGSPGVDHYRKILYCSK